MYVVFATREELRVYLGLVLDSALPVDTQRLIVRASELVGQAIEGNYINTNAEHIEATKLATCAQVELWLSASENKAIEGGIKSYSIGDVSVTYSDSALRESDLSKRARGYLNKVGLLYRGLKKGRSYEAT